VNNSIVGPILHWFKTVGFLLKQIHGTHFCTSRNLYTTIGLHQHYRHTVFV